MIRVIRYSGPGSWEPSRRLKQSLRKRYHRIVTMTTTLDQHSYCSQQNESFNVTTYGSNASFQSSTLPIASTGGHSFFKTKKCMYGASLDSLLFLPQCHFSTSSDKQKNQNQETISQHSVSQTNSTKNTTKIKIKASDKELLSNSTQSFMDTYLPSSFHPYARLARMDKPIGTALLLWPCFWSTAIAAPPGMYPDPMLLGLFTIGR